MRRVPACPRAASSTVELHVADRRLEIANTNLEELRDGLAVIADRLAEISAALRWIANSPRIASRKSPIESRTGRLRRRSRRVGDIHPPRGCARGGRRRAYRRLGRSRRCRSRLERHQRRGSSWTAFVRPRTHVRGTARRGRRAHSPNWLSRSGARLLRRRYGYYWTKLIAAARRRDLPRRVRLDR
jgi:hypothetical protein